MLKRNKKLLWKICALIVGLTTALALISCEQKNETSNAGGYSSENAEDNSINSATPEPQFSNLEYTLNQDGASYSVTGLGDCQDAEIIIPAEYENKPVTTIGKEAFYNCKIIIDVTIPDSITAIDYLAFQGCENLKNVYITDMAAWCGIQFDSQYSNPLQDAENLYLDTQLVKALILPDTVTEIQPYVFYGLDSLTDVTIPDSVIKIGTLAFGCCKNLTNVDIGNKAEFIGWNTFSECDSLKNIVIPDSVTEMDSAVFWKCKNLESVMLSKNLETIESNTFYGCESLKEIVIPDSVVSINGQAFAYCTDLAKVKMGESVTFIGNESFYACESLQSFTIPNGVKTICAKTFYGCSNLERLYLGKGLVAIQNNAFYGCYQLKEVHIKDIAAWCAINFWATPFQYGGKLYFNNECITQLVIPNGVKRICNGAFESCSQITSVVLPASIEVIDSAFSYCNFTEVYYEGTEEDWEEVTVLKMNYEFNEATRYYYSEEEPALNAEGTAYDGNYWRYENGVPTVWEME